MPPASNGRGAERYLYNREQAADPLPVRRHAILLRVERTLLARSICAPLRALISVW
jgi:hypothetical protein